MKANSVFSVALAIACTIATEASAASPFRQLSADRIFHVASGATFPARVGAFRFLGTKIYNPNGRDVGAEYDVDQLIRGDVYVYPLSTYAKDLRGEVRHQQSDIARINKNVRLVSQGPFSLRVANRTFSGFRAEYQLTRPLFGSLSCRCGSQFYLFQDGSWLFAYRFSYPIEKAVVANQHIGNFLSQWQWRARGNVARSYYGQTYACVH